MARNGQPRRQKRKLPDPGPFREALAFYPQTNGLSRDSNGVWIPPPGTPVRRKDRGKYLRVRDHVSRSNTGKIPKIRYSVDTTLIGRQSDPLLLHGVSWEGLLLSEPHFKLRSGAWSGGGPLFVYKTSVVHSPRLVIPIQVGFAPWWTIDDVWVARGVAPSPASTRGNASYLADAQAAMPLAAIRLNGQGAAAYEKARPGNPRASLGVGLLELASPAIFGKGLGKLEGLPQIPQGFKALASDIVSSRRVKRGLEDLFGRRGALNKGIFRDLPWNSVVPHARERVGAFRLLGGEFLNVEFGWKPFIKDLQDVIDTACTLQDKIDQIIRENGKPIRRKGRLSEDRDVDQTGQAFPFPYANVYGAPPLYGVMGSGHTIYSVTTEVEEHISYSFGFRYWIPDTGDPSWLWRARAVLFGVAPTPSVIWEAMPWSWLADWFSNFGAIYSNLSPNAVDNLVTTRAFLMRHWKSRTLYKAAVSHPGDSGYYNFPGEANTFTTTVVQETKARVMGVNPFGLPFGTAPSLDARQLGILAALGVTRG